MKSLEMIQISSLEKFRGKTDEVKEIKELDVLRDEEFSYQLVCFAKTDDEYEIAKTVVTVETDIEGSFEISTVKNVPVEMPCYPGVFDEDYLSTEPGLYPDVLFPIENNKFELASDMPYTLWINVKPSENNTAGVHKIKITVSEENGQKSTKELIVNTAGEKLAPQKLIFTQWMHYDCIANYHKVEVFSEEFWTIAENYISVAAKNGINMILTPVFTPPLDTEKGGERRTVQLVEIYKEGNDYRFDFEKLERFTNMCLKNNIKYFEIPPLFTQWGSEAAPKIMVHTENGLEKLFGWNVSADSEEYKSFLKAFLPSLVEFYEALGLADKIYFHVSDEPTEKNKQAYNNAKKKVKPYVKDCKIIDALSEFSFYLEGVVENPVAATDHIDNFLDHGVKPWAYYCCGQKIDVCNRFMAMPSRRNRMLGIIMYKYDIEGFLHWGFNFYNSFLSRTEIDPYFITDADRQFPAGDSFSVYPYKDGAAESLRIKVFYDALQDMRALMTLENKIGRDAVIKLIDETAGRKITFKDYPHCDEYIFEIRRKINLLLK